MGGIEKKQVFQKMRFNESEKIQSKQVQWVLIEAKNIVADKYKSDFIRTDSDVSSDSLESSSSFEMTEDTSSSSSSLISSHVGPLYELSELMAQLPIKKGLSKYYQGKSESFGSLASLKSFEDLAKRSCKSRKSTKLCKSYGGGQTQSQRLSPKASIIKKSSSPSTTRSSLFSSLGKMSSLLDTIHVQNHL